MSTASGASISTTAASCTVWMMRHGVTSRSLASEILEILEIVCYDGFGKYWKSRVILEISFTRPHPAAASMGAWPEMLVKDLAFDMSNECLENG